LEPDLEIKTCRMSPMPLSYLPCVPGAKTHCHWGPSHILCLPPSWGSQSDKLEQVQSTHLARKRQTPLVDIRTWFSVWKVNWIISPSLCTTSVGDHLGRNLSDWRTLLNDEGLIELVWIILSCFPVCICRTQCQSCAAFRTELVQLHYFDWWTNRPRESKGFTYPAVHKV
jgi:hypothetical protein